MVSVHVDAVKVSFLVDSLFTLVAALDANTAAKGPFEEVEKQDPDGVEDDVEELGDACHLHHSIKRAPSPLEHVKYRYDSVFTHCADHRFRRAATD